MEHKPSINNPVVRSGKLCPYQPTGDRVLVEKIEGVEEMVGGLVIPGTEKAISLYATVVSAGCPALDILRDMCIEIGDTVCIGKYSGVVWEWRPEGQTKFERVDVINVKDIYGCVQLAQKVADGRIGIGLVKEYDGVTRHRYLRELTPEEAAQEEKEAA